MSHPQAPYTAGPDPAADARALPGWAQLIQQRLDEPGHDVGCVPDEEVRQLLGAYTALLPAAGAPQLTGPDKYTPPAPEALTLGHLERLVAAGQGCSSESLRGFYDLLQSRLRRVAVLEFAIETVAETPPTRWDEAITDLTQLLPGNGSRWTFPVPPLGGPVKKPTEDICPICGAPTDGPGWHCDACAEMGNHLPDAQVAPATSPHFLSGNPAINPFGPR